MKIWCRKDENYYSKFMSFSSKLFTKEARKSNDQDHKDCGCYGRKRGPQP